MTLAMDVTTSMVFVIEDVNQAGRETTVNNVIYKMLSFKNNS